MLLTIQNGVEIRFDGTSVFWGVCHCCQAPSGCLFIFQRGSGALEFGGEDGTHEVGALELRGFYPPRLVWHQPSCARCARS